MNTKMSNVQNGWMNITEFCQQRTRFRLQHKPPPRLEGLPYNPYELQTSGISPAEAQRRLDTRRFQLDMRRKAEVLKYSGVASNTKTNGMTKAEKYAHLAKFSNGYTKYSSFTQRLDELKQGCPVEETLYYPTSSSDVPGPIMLLYMDEKEDLYNYTRGNTTVAVENETTQEPYSIVSYYDVSGVGGLEGISTSIQYGDHWVYSLFVNDLEERTYSFDIPVGFYFSGDVSLNTPVNIIVKKIYIYVYYNQTLISTNDDTILYTKVYDAPTIEWETFNLSNFTVSTAANIVGHFESEIYLGNVHLTNFTICSQSSAVYDIRIAVEYEFSPDGILLSYGTLANYSVTRPRQIGYDSTKNGVSFDSAQFADVSVSSETTIQPDAPVITSSIASLDSALYLGTNNGLSIANDVNIGYDGLDNELSDIFFYGNLDFSEMTPTVLNIGWIDQFV